jgi:hypothetical protein
MIISLCMPVRAYLLEKTELVKREEGESVEKIRGTKGVRPVLFGTWRILGRDRGWAKQAAHLFLFISFSCLCSRMIASIP